MLKGLKFVENLRQTWNTLKGIYSPSGLGGAQEKDARATEFSLDPHKKKKKSRDAWI